MPSDGLSPEARAARAGLSAARAEVRATLARMRANARRNSDSRLLRIRQRLSKTDFAAPDLDDEPNDPAADETLPPDYVPNDNR